MEAPLVIMVQSSSSICSLSNCPTQSWQGPSSFDPSLCAVQVLVTRLAGSTDESLHLVVLSFDGYLYLIDGLTGDGLSITSPAANKHASHESVHLRCTSRCC